MTTIELSRARKRIIRAYEIVRQTHGEGSMVKQVVGHLQLRLDKNGGHSWVRRVLKDYMESKS